MKKYDIALFDLDGTLIRSERGVVGAVVYSLERLGIPYGDRDRLKVFIGPPLRQSYMSVFGMTEEEAERAVAEYRVYYRAKGVFDNDAYDGISSVLERLKSEGYKLAVATSKPKTFAEKILGDLGLYGYFDAVAGAELDGAMSDKAELIRSATRALGGGSVVMIGDTRFDVNGAKEVGVDSVGVLYGYGTREELVSAGATYIAREVCDIPSLLIY